MITQLLSSRYEKRFVFACVQCLAPMLGAAAALPAYRFHLALIYVTMDWVINHMLRNADKRGY